MPPSEQNGIGVPRLLPQFQCLPPPASSSNAGHKSALFKPQQHSKNKRELPNSSEGAATHCLLLQPTRQPYHPSSTTAFLYSIPDISLTVQLIHSFYTSSWEQRKLGEIGSVSMCRRIFKEQTSETGDIPFYKIGTFGAEPDAFISRELFEEYKSKYPYPKKGDILISASGSIGRTVEFAGNNEYFQDSNIVWLSHDERLSNSFLKCFYSVVKWAGIEGSTIKRLYNDNILNTVICMPSVPEQEHIGLFFENLDNLITLHQRKGKAAVSGCFLNCSSIEKSSALSRTLKLFGQISNQEIKYIIDGLSILGGKLRNFCVKLIILLSYTRINDIAKYHISRNTECVHNIN